MSKKCRSLRQQINYAISENCRIGHSKRAEQGTDTGYVYSVQYAENLRDTAKNFANYMKVEHPEIRWVRDIRSEHLQEWIDTRCKNWTKATLDNHISRIKIIKKQIDRTYKIDTEWNINSPVQVNKRKVRDIAMEREDYNKLQEFLDGSKSVAKYAVAITARTGLRIKEVARLKVENINLNKMVIEVREGAKNGKYRDVRIRPADKEYFTTLRQELAGQEYVCNGVTEDSINKAIRRALQKLGLDEKYEKTTNHAIRKMFAQDYYYYLRDMGFDKKTAWNAVQLNLGHGLTYRQSLFDTYIGK